MSGASFSKEALDFEISFIQVLLGEANHWHEECQHRQGKCVDSIDFVSLHKKRCFPVSKFEEYLCIAWNSLAFSELFSAENPKFSQSFPLGNRQ